MLYSIFIARAQASTAKTNMELKRMSRIWTKESTKDVFVRSVSFWLFWDGIDFDLSTDFVPMMKIRNTFRVINKIILHYLQFFVDSWCGTSDMMLYKLLSLFEQIWCYLHELSWLIRDNFVDRTSAGDQIILSVGSITKIEMNELVHSNSLECIKNLQNIPIQQWLLRKWS